MRVAPILEKRPIPPERRRRYEGLIRFIDIADYFAVFAGGVYALFFTPDSVTIELAGWPWLIGVWASLLLVGGLLGFVGRLTRYWVIEVPGTVAAIFGILIYFVILGRVVSLSITAAVAAVLVFLAMSLMVRRYLELQIFSSEPGDNRFADRVAAMIRRRTSDVVPRDE